MKRPLRQTPIGDAAVSSLLTLEKGSFNWRWKFKTFFPLREDDYGGDRFKIQIWDKDIVSSDELIGENDISLNMHNMVQKLKGLLII